MTTPLSRPQTVPLIPLARTALATAVEITGHSETDTVNRALQLYAVLVEQRAAGAELLVRHGDNVQTIGWDQ